MTLALMLGTAHSLHQITAAHGMLLASMPPWMQNDDISCFFQLGSNLPDGSLERTHLMTVNCKTDGMEVDPQHDHQIPGIASMTPSE